MMSCIKLVFIFASLTTSTTGFSPLWGVSKRPACRLYAEPFLSVTLEKPLGLLLEEIDEGAPSGVKVQDLVETGSAYASKYKDRLVGLKVAKVQGESVGTCTFDDVMEKIIDAPSPVTIDFEVESSTEKEIAVPAALEPELPIGTLVTLTINQEGKADLAIAAKVGDNLRTTLLENNVELYRGLKKKLGNCGGGGQCTFCAVEITEAAGWGERSDWEDKKIGNKLGPNARLACMNNIQGPAVVRTL
jgi:ferredoxin